MMDHHWYYQSGSIFTEFQPVRLSNKWITVTFPRLNNIFEVVYIGLKDTCLQDLVCQDVALTATLKDECIDTPAQGSRNLSK